MSVETYTGVGLDNGVTGNEFRICQRPLPSEIIREDVIGKIMKEKYGDDDAKNWDSNIAHLRSLTDVELFKILNVN